MQNPVISIVYSTAKKTKISYAKLLLYISIAIG